MIFNKSKGCMAVHRSAASLLIAHLTAAAGTALAAGPPNGLDVTVVNDTGSPVPVELTNSAIPVDLTNTTVDVRVTNLENNPVPTADVLSPGSMPVRFGPVLSQIFPGDGIPVVGAEVIPPVVAGETFILTHLHALLFSNISSVPLVTGRCNVQLRIPEGGGSTFPTFARIPLEESRGALHGTLATFLPLSTDEGIHVQCVGEGEGGALVSQGFRATAGGYFVPAAP